jgi:hypothetical protein
MTGKEELLFLFGLGGFLGKVGEAFGCEPFGAAPLVTLALRGNIFAVAERRAFPLGKSVLFRCKNGVRPGHDNILPARLFGKRESSG